MQMRKVAYVLLSCMALAIWLAPTIAFGLIHVRAVKVARLAHNAGRLVGGAVPAEVQQARNE